MASVSPHDVRIPFALFEAITRAGLTGRERSVLDVILRDALGRRRSFAELSLRDFALRAAMDRHNVRRTLQRLCARGVVKVDHSDTGVVKNDYRYKTRYILQVEFNKWLSVGVVMGDYSRKQAGVVKTAPTGVVKSGRTGVVKTAPPPNIDVNFSTSTPNFSTSTDNFKDARTRANDTPIPDFLKPIQPVTGPPSDLASRYINGLNQREVAQKRKREPVVLPEPLRNLLLCFKATQGYESSHAEWDRVCIKRYANDAADLLALFDGNWKLAVQCIAEVGGRLSDIQRSWTLDTIIKHAPEWRSQNARQNKA